MPAAVLCLLVALACFPASARACQSPVGQRAEGRIHGRVVDARTGAGIAFAEVTLDEGAASVAADDQGRFEFRGVTPGAHRVSARVTGFAPSAPLGVTVSARADADVQLPYNLEVTTEVHGAPQRESPVAAAPVGRVTLRGRDVASAVGGLDDVSRVLQLRPGVVAAQDDRNDLIVRGGGPLETQVVMDGFELPTVSHFGAAGSASGGISLVPSEVIESVTLEAGGFGVAHGERASSLVEIEPRARAGDGSRAGGTVSVGAGGVLALAGGPAGADGGWVASVRRSILETAFSRGNARAVPRYADLSGRISTKVGERHELRVLALGARDSADVSPIQSTRPSTIKDEQRLALAGLGLRTAWSRKTSTSLTLSYSRNETDAFRDTAGVIDGRELSEEAELRVRAEVRRLLAHGAEVLAGATLRRSMVRYELRDTGYRNEYGIYVQPLNSRWRDRVTEPAGFVEAAVPAGSRLRLSAGLRAERPGTSGAWYATPRARLQYDAAARLRLIASSGLYRQATPFIWVASWPGNSALAPIRAAFATAGAEARGAWGRLAVEGFVKRYRGYPVDPTEPPRVLISAGTDFDTPFVGRLVSAGVVHASGVDLSLERALGARARISGSYSHWRVVQRGLDNLWRPGDFDIRHQARVVGAWHPHAKWEASASWRYASGRPYTPFDVAASLRAGAGRYDRKSTNALAYSPYARLDVRLARVFTRGRTVVTAFVEVENATDHDNIYAYAWSRAARRPDPILQWGRTPLGGIRVEF